jgi:uroporphyrinogen-III synthase
VDNQDSDRGFGGATVVSFESRRADEMASLIKRHGGVPVAAQTMREVAISDAADGAHAFAKSLAAGDFDVVVLMTGVGTRGLAKEIESTLPEAAFADALRKVRLIARGPKPAQVLRAMGVTTFEQAPEPNTWRELDAMLAGSLEGKRIAIQEHGAPSEELYSALRERGAVVTPVLVYRWALPEDTRPLKEALTRIAGGGVDVALFTSRAQIEHLFIVAAELGIEPDVRHAFKKMLLGSIGPVCTEGLRLEGLSPALEPTHPKMGHLVKEMAGHLAARKGAPLSTR